MPGDKDASAQAHTRNSCVQDLSVDLVIHDKLHMPMTIFRRFLGMRSGLWHTFCKSTVA